MTQLRTETLPLLPPDVRTPGYDRSAVRTGIVHIGLGAFHRAHQAVFIEDVLEQGDPRWGVMAVAMRSRATGEALARQDRLFTVVTRDGEKNAARVIGALTTVGNVAQNAGAVIAAIAAPDTHLVTLTVTERGYHLDKSGTALDRDDPDIVHDLSKPDVSPTTVPGLLVAAFAARRAASEGPLTVLSCDNLSDNGAKLRAVVMQMAAGRDRSLTEWIERSVRFPSSMVDRIVPATTEADRDHLERSLGLRDDAMVKTEPFRQWVIENDFAGPMPDLASVGAIVTGDVGAWERAKLQILNGSHSSIAYLGLLRGIEYVHDFVADVGGADFVRSFWDETAASLDPESGPDLPSYRAAIMQRFENSALRHRLDQIALSGTRKMPERLGAPLAWRLARGLQSPAMSTGLAAWILCLRDGILRDDPDPAAAALFAVLAKASGSARLAEIALRDSELFRFDEKSLGALVGEVTEAIDRLERSAPQSH